MDKKDKELGQVMYAVHKLNDSRTIHGGTDTSFDIMNIAAPKAGSYKYRRPDTGEELIVPPGDPMYSSAGIYAHEMYDGENWISLEDL